MTTAVTPALRRIALAELHESKHNPRSIFDPQEMKELEDSMRASGQLTPLLVRPHPNGKGGYEIAAGACRRRVAEAAGLTHLDAIVRDLDDATFVEFVNVENRQRNNLHALDEARGFADWMKTAGLKIPDIAARIGLSTKYVYDRLKLLQLIKPAQKLFLEGKFEAGHAILLARLSPDDQKRAIGDPSDRHNFADNRVGGLFLPEHVDEEGLGLEEEPRKPASVREFARWIDDHVRFIPEKEDLPNLFPETATALTVAKEEELKVVKITRDYRVPDEAKDPKERTYGEASWKRADGIAEPSRFGRTAAAKTCDFSVLGVVVAGPGRGEAFKVCVNKDKCTVHWAAEKAERARRAKSNGAKPQSGQSGKDYWAKENARRKAEEKKDAAVRARWKTAEPALLEAADAAIAKAATKAGSVVSALVIGRILRQHKQAKTPLSTSANAEDILRYLARCIVADVLSNHYWAQREAPKMLAPFGINAQKILDQVAPEEPKAAPAKSKPAAKKAKVGKKKLAGDVARARAKKKAKAKKGAAR
jgi:ParB/RepB/Spo0J family partition protein